MDASTRTDTHASKYITETLALILVPITIKCQPDKILKMDHLKTRTGHALTTGKKVFGSLMSVANSSSGIILNSILLSALK